MGKGSRDAWYAVELRSKVLGLRWLRFIQGHYLSNYFRNLQNQVKWRNGTLNKKRKLGFLKRVYGINDLTLVSREEEGSEKNMQSFKLLGL